MDEDNRSGVASENQLDDLTRCYVRPIQRTAEQLDEIDEMMARREQQHAEDLVFQVRKTRYQEVFDGAWRAEHRSACHTLREYGERRLDDCRIGNWRDAGLGVLKESGAERLRRSGNVAAI